MPKFYLLYLIKKGIVPVEVALSLKNYSRDSGKSGSSHNSSKGSFTENTVCGTPIRSPTPASVSLVRKAEATALLPLDEMVVTVLTTARKNRDVAKAVRDLGKGDSVEMAQQLVGLLQNFDTAA